MERVAIWFEPQVHLRYAQDCAQFLWMLRMTVSYFDLKKGSSGVSSAGCA